MCTNIKLNQIVIKILQSKLQQRAVRDTFNV